ncbi:MAG: methylated-DNA--[protein]-cysteine S-methyltransferase [Betaproteobacteria bacterium]
MNDAACGRRWALFDTALGRCGIAWSERGIVAVQLPEADDAATRRGLLHRLSGAIEAEPAGDARRAVQAIRALLEGARADLRDLVLDEDGIDDFQRRVYAATRAIAPGETQTYGELARRIGEPDAARAVGRALGRNPYTLIVPCHRVLAAHGATGGFSAHGGVATKLRLLAIEGARPPQGATLALDF